MSNTICATCNGRGKYSDSLDITDESRPCPDCAGKGPTPTGAIRMTEDEFCARAAEHLAAWRHHPGGLSDNRLVQMSYWAAAEEHADGAVESLVAALEAENARLTAKLADAEKAAQLLPSPLLVGDGEREVLARHVRVAFQHGIGLSVCRVAADAILAAGWRKIACLDKVKLMETIARALDDAHTWGSRDRLIDEKGWAADLLARVEAESQK